MSKHKDTCELTLGKIFQNIEFRHALYPKAIEVTKHLKTFGKVVLYTEGDSVYQKIKIEKSGLEEVADSVELYEHKLEHLKEIVKKFKGYRVVVIEDRSDTLLKIKKQFPNVMAIEVCQGHYATVDRQLYQEFEMTVMAISGLLNLKTKNLIF